MICLLYLIELQTILDGITNGLKINPIITPKMKMEKLQIQLIHQQENHGAGLM